MKKIIALVILVACVLSLCSCGVMALPFDILLSALGGASSELNPDYEEAPEEFHFEELAITLTEAFYLTLYYDTGASYDSLAGTNVTVDKYEFMYSQYSAGLSLEEYAEQMRAELIAEGEELADGTIVDIEVDGVVRDGELVYFTYETKILVSFGVLRAVYVSKDALWVVNFTCDASSFEVYKPHFISWAKTVVINNVNATA